MNDALHFSLSPIDQGLSGPSRPIGLTLNSGLQAPTHEPADTQAPFRRNAVGRRRSEVDLYCAMRAAKSANEAKDEYLATVCHEIRNPVSVLIGTMDLAMQTTLSDEQQEYLRLMRTSSSLLLSVVNNSLDLARLESGRLETENIHFSLRESLGDAVQMLAFEAQRKQLVLAYDIAPDIPDDLIGDPLRLRQVVLNLLGNAVKFTAEGDVVMCVALQSVDDTQVVCRFDITDCGPGIPEDRQSAIFEPFEQVDPSIARHYGGSGLGLHISARLVRMMGGTISVSSRPGHGSTFTFTACFGCLATQEQASETLIGDDLRVLVVEDHAASRRFLVNTLRQWNIEPHEADDQASMLEQIACAKRIGKPYQLVLLDERLAGSGSPDFVAHLAREQASHEVHVILLGTSLKRSDYRVDRSDSSGLPAGFSCLTMPLKVSDLRRVVASVMGEKNTREAVLARSVVAPTSGNPLWNLSILLVDDNSLNCRFAQLVLEKEGCRVVQADSAASALVTLEREQMDLVLMDLQMPKIDGFEATKRIRQYEEVRGQHIPIIALTASIRPEEREHCLVTGMDGYLTKPIQPESLAELVKQLSESRTRASETKQTLGPSLDRQALLLSVGGDRKLLSEIVDMFPQHCDKLIRKVRDAIRRRDGTAFSSAVHTIVGMFRNLSAPAAQALAVRLQHVAVEREPERAKATFRLLENEVWRLKILLADLKGTSRRPARKVMQWHRSVLMARTARISRGSQSAQSTAMKASFPHHLRSGVSVSCVLSRLKRVHRHPRISERTQRLGGQVR